MNAKEEARKEEEARAELPRVNFRPLLFCALGLCCGVFVCLRTVLGGLSPSDFVPAALFLLCALRPFRFKRLAAVFLCFLLGAAAGAGLSLLSAQRYLLGAEEGEHTVTGTAVSVTPGHGYSVAVLSDLIVDGERTGGKLRGYFASEELRTGDVLSFEAEITRYGLAGDAYSEYLFANDIRYTVYEPDFEVTGGAGGLLALNAKLYDVLHGNMAEDEADVSYALLTGNSAAIDDGLLTAVRQGGIAHIFAVSGLHIGILYAAALWFFSLLFRPPRLKRCAFLPALALAVCYSAFCAFSVSSVRAVIMCGTLGVTRALGRKPDFVQSISFAAVLVLLFSPAQFLTAGFRLSFGACVGLALFSGSFSRGLRKLHIPASLAGYLAANFSVQLVTFPILLECFGYVSVWGTLFNLILIPLMPVLFLGLLLCAAAALALPVFAAVLIVPEGMVSLLIFVLALCDLSFVLTGFSLGAGGAVVLCGCILLTQRVRLNRLLRGCAAGVFCLLFALCLFVENAVPGGCKIVTYAYGSGDAVLVRTNGEAVLIIDGDISLSRCEDFLNRTYGGTLDAVFVLSDDGLDGINVAVFLPTQAVYAMQEAETGLRETAVIFGGQAQIGGLLFRFESAEKLALVAEGTLVEFDFENAASLSADLFYGGGVGGLKYFLKDGIIKSL